MSTIYAWKGLPGCGKSHHAAELMKSFKTPVTQVTRDDIRMLLFGRYTKVNEIRVTEAQDDLINGALRRGHDVFVPDTNLSPLAIEHLQRLAVENDVSLVWHDMTDVPPWICIENDQKRDRQVGAKVIWDMWERYLKPVHPGDPGLPHAILVDVDGTLSLHTGNRSPFDWHRVGEDDVNPMVVKAVQLFSQEYKILIVSGRDGVCRPETQQWLYDNGVFHDALYMRPEGDSRKDSIVKLEILEEIKKSYFPALCIDDRKQVVEAYRHAGLPVWAVARGDF